MGYIRITAGRFRLEDDNGNPAARGKVYTYTAGTTTAATSYSDRLLTVANTNPIILDERGECELYTNTALKLIATDLNDVVIWTEDYQGEQEEEYIISGNASGDANNNYTMTVTPPFAAFPTVPLTIVMTPDTTNVDTLYSESIVGVTGINDLTWKGPYKGTTTNSIFSVQIDGVRFHGTVGVDLNDLSWNGDLAGSVHTVIITTASTPDRFKWRKDGGSWSAEIIITGALQALDGDVSITFGATTGHTLNTYWNNKDTFQWKKDGGAWTIGVPIYPQINTPQTLQEDVGVIFASQTGHTLNDVWTLTVKTPARLNFCSLGNKLIEYNEAGTLKPLNGGDIVDGYPASLVYSPDQDRFVLLNPSLPVLTSLPRSVFRREVVDNVTLQASDGSNELAFIGTAAKTLTLLPCAETSGDIFDLVNASAYDWTIQTDPTHTDDRIITPESPGGVTSFILGPTTRLSCRLESNGINWHLPFDAGRLHGLVKFTTTTTWVCPDGVYTVYASGCGPGGGGSGCSAANPGGGGGDAGQSTLVQSVTVVPGTSYLITVPAGGAGGGPGIAGTAGANLTFGALLTLTGGAGGPLAGGAYVTSTGNPSDIFMATGECGQGGPFGGGGVGAAIGAAAGSAVAKNGGAATGYGAGGGGAAGLGDGSGGNGSGGFLRLEW